MYYPVSAACWILELTLKAPRDCCPAEHVIAGVAIRGGSDPGDTTANYIEKVYNRAAGKRILQCICDKTDIKDLAEARSATFRGWSALANHVPEYSICLEWQVETSIIQSILVYLLVFLLLTAAV